ncbi:MAG: sulfatase-like hydrolase/transferase [Rikenellaceae bacterium]
MKTTSVLPILGLGLVSAFTSEAKKAQPNVIVIMSDDMGYGDFGCYGNTYHKTPNIDLLAQKGAKFTDFHSNGALSSPTRAAFMTGRYQQRSGIEGVVSAEGHRDVGLDTSNQTIAKLLKANGYNTAMYGKWHLGYDVKYNPINHGFDEFVGYVSGNVDYFSHIDQANQKDWWVQDKLHEEEGYTTELIAKYAVNYINRKHDKPFFLYLPFEATHGPYQAPDDTAVRGVSAAERKANDAKKVKRSGKETYKLMVESLDDAVGNIMQALKDKGLEDNTVVFFFSDNGGANLSTNKPLTGRKGSVLEGGHRVSSVVYSPKMVKAGAVLEQTAMTMDLLPTICDITSVKTKKVETDGVSLWPMLTKGAKIGERTLFWRTYTEIAVRRGDWKLSYTIRGVNSTELLDVSNVKGKLVNLKDDLAEKTNLWDQNPEIVKELLQEIKEWEASFKDVAQKSAVPISIIKKQK